MATTFTPSGSVSKVEMDCDCCHTANRATTSFTLVGHSADFTLSVFPLASSGGRNLTTLAKTHNDMGQKFYTTRCFYGRNHLFTTFFSFPRLSATLRG